MENAQKGEETIIIASHLTESGILLHDMEKLLLLIIREADIAGNHDLGGTGLDLTLGNETVLARTLFPGDGRSS